MKTDRFTDIIRRKLESIRPEFTDKDWARMHSTLKDANLSPPNLPSANGPVSGGVWSGQSWLLAAATISTVVLIAFSIWQRREINHLRQTIGQLHSQPANPSVPTPANSAPGEQTRPPIAQADGATSSKRIEEIKTTPNRNEGQGVRPDTVYGTQYVTAPLPTRADIRKEEPLAKRLKIPTQQRHETENPVPASVTLPQSTNQNQQTEFNDKSSTPSITKNLSNESQTATIGVRSATKANGSVSRNTSGRDTKQSDRPASTEVDKQNSVAANNPVAPTESPATASQSSATYELATSLPLSIGNKNWTMALAQRAKRMQPVRLLPVIEQPQTPASSQTAQRAATRFRAGIGGEVAPRLWSAGVFTEVLVGRHWIVGAGLSQATYFNRFITDEDFNDRTKRDFRREFGRDIDLRREILNIDAQQLRLQVPISLGYRISLNRSLTLLPTVGTYLNLTNAENVTYYCSRPQKFPQPPQSQRGFDEFSSSRSQPVALVNSLALGAGIEWQRGHWVVQAMPILTIPAQTNVQATKPDLNSQKNTTVGLRARLLYQF